MTENEAEIKPLKIIGSYNRQRFDQWSREDTANWYVAVDEESKQPTALYPVLGRSHINYRGFNRLIFDSEPRGLFKTVNYMYIVVGNTIYQVNSSYNVVNITPTAATTLQTLNTPIYFATLVFNTTTFAVFVDGEKVYIFQEGDATLQVVTDTNCPGNYDDTKPGFVAAFGNRITVSIKDSARFVLSQINLGGQTYSPANCFTNDITPQVFAQEDGIIRQMGVLNNNLYIYCDYTTGIWSNIVAVFSGTGTTFPWKKNSTYNWNFGIANPGSLDIDFGKMVFLARNTNGLLQFMVSEGGMPEVISNKAVNTLLQKYTDALGANNPFLAPNANGFLYQYEDTIFYRISGGDYHGYGILDQEFRANSIEFGFEGKEWHRCIEKNGERNRVRFHVYFNFKHLVSIIEDGTIYDMSGQYYFNEIKNPEQPDPYFENSYLVEPIRYERYTNIIFEQGYAEFETEYVQIDFVWGRSDFPNLIENIETPQLYNPIVELYFSDDGGVSFLPADSREFSNIGEYIWRMRWYQLGTSRCRVYKLVCTAVVPITILGGTMKVKRVSGGAD